MGRWSLTAVAAHERRQNSRVVHSAVQPPEQRPHAVGDDGGIPAAVCASSGHGERLHLELLPAFSIRVLTGRYADGVLPAVAEATVLVLMVLEEVVDGSQPHCATRAAAAPAGTVTVSVASIAATAASIRIHLFTPFAGEEIWKLTKHNITHKCVCECVSEQHFNHFSTLTQHGS